MKTPTRARARLEDGSRRWFVAEPGGGWYLWRTHKGEWLTERVRVSTHHPPNFAWRLEDATGKAPPCPSPSPTVPTCGGPA